LPSVHIHVSQLVQRHEAHLIAFFTSSELRDAAREREGKSEGRETRSRRYMQRETEGRQRDAEEEGTRYNNALEGEICGGLNYAARAKLRGSSFRGTIRARRRNPRDPCPEFLG